MCVYERLHTCTHDNTSQVDACCHRFSGYTLRRKMLWPNRLKMLVLNSFDSLMLSNIFTPISWACRNFMSAYHSLQRARKGEAKWKRKCEGVVHYNVAHHSSTLPVLFLFLSNLGRRRSSGGRELLLSALGIEAALITRERAFFVEALSL